MKLTLTTDDGDFLESWYVPEELAQNCGQPDQPPNIAFRDHIEIFLPVFTDCTEYESLRNPQRKRHE